MQAALHLDLNYANNLEKFKNSEFENIESLFNVMNMMKEFFSKIPRTHRRRDPHCLWIKQKEWTKARVYSTRIKCYACEKRSIPKMQSKDGKDTCQIYRCSLLSENYNGEPIAFE